MIDWLLAWRYLFSTRRVLQGASGLSLAGLILGVASLVTSMAVISGVENFLKTAIREVTGDVALMKPGGGIYQPEVIIKKLKEEIPEIKEGTAFIHLDVVVAAKGKISGAMLQGLDAGTVESVLKVRDRVIAGHFDISSVEATALVGKELAKKLELGVGDTFQIAYPRPLETAASGFSKKIKPFKIAGILDLGKYEYNERTILVSDKWAQDFAVKKNAYSGIRFSVQDPSRSGMVGQKISAALGDPYWTRDWQEVSANFFEAVRLEKAVIFIVLFFMVIVAAFNMSHALSIHVFRHFRDISILKAMGAQKSSLVRIFAYQGFLLGLVGVVGGLGLSALLIKLVRHLPWIKIPPDIYKFDHLPAEMQLFDISIIVVSTLVVCWLSALRPARRGAELEAVEGFRYD